MELKKKYLAELSDLASPFFSSTPSSTNITKHIPSRFVSANTSELFPDVPTKKILRVRTEKNFKTRPMTTSASVNRIESAQKQERVAHTAKYETFEAYASSLKYMNSLLDDLSINFLLVSATEKQNTVLDTSNSFFDDLNRDKLIDCAKSLTIELRSCLKNHEFGSKIEAIWRGVIKVLDKAFYLCDVQNKAFQTECENLCDFRVEEIQKQYDKLHSSSTNKILLLTEELGKHRDIIVSVEQELGLKSRIIKERDRKIDEMNNFENKQLAIYRLKRMMKGLNDFINETEFENHLQEFTLNGITKMLEAN
jgi:hypothetical protein